MDPRLSRLAHLTPHFQPKLVKLDFHLRCFLDAVLPLFWLLVDISLKRVCLYQALIEFVRFLYVS